MFTINTKLIRLCSLLSLCFIACKQKSAQAAWVEQSQHGSFKVEKILQEKRAIWGFDFVSDQHIIYTLVSGQIKLFDLKSKSSLLIKDLDNVYVGGQGGLLDIAVHHNQNKTKSIYFCYSTKTKEGQSTALAKADLSNNKLENLKTLFTAQPYFKTSHHFGCRIAFDGQGSLFLSVGDRGNRDLAQSLNSHNGKILRLDLDGKPAKNNPFVKTKDAKPEIWSYGHRNPQGLFFDINSNTLYEQEHGPKGGDEINIIEKGKNYGWPIITYGKEYSGFKINGGLNKKDGLEQPLHYYVPSIAPSGLAQYRGTVLKFWDQDLFSGALALTHINRIRIKNGKVVEEERLLKNLKQRIRHVKMGPDEKLYFSTDSGDLYCIDANNNPGI
ncbi:MAG TPA: PQQ-dependent sugar dehydrogenase [Oligoflexia bacterium]|nr:PQQ-dependent sugar dehydrogenase [Oligoflexia bacterium]HMR25248.1 PQQ-dependent sugar dehydrogenase [Oligoflexia bacterium]